MSHTVAIKVEYRDIMALRRAVIAIGGHWLGHGVHRLYGRNEATGQGFSLPGWSYPIVLTAPDNLAYDSYRAARDWAETLGALKIRYALEVARGAAEAQGWYTELYDDRLIVYHPDGGTVTVDAAGVDASGFQGQGCMAAIDAIGNAMGHRLSAQAKPEYDQVHQHITEVC